jgi:hypothetical protein
MSQSLVCYNWAGFPEETSAFSNERWLKKLRHAAQVRPSLIQYVTSKHFPCFQRERECVSVRVSVRVCTSNVFKGHWKGDSYCSRSICSIISWLRIKSTKRATNGALNCTRVPSNIPVHIAPNLERFQSKPSCSHNHYQCKTTEWPPLWSSGQSSWRQIRRPGFDSRHYQKKK